MTAELTDCQSAELKEKIGQVMQAKQKFAVIFLAHNLFLSIMSKYLVVARVHSKPSDFFAALILKKTIQHQVSKLI